MSDRDIEGQPATEPDERQAAEPGPDAATGEAGRESTFLGPYPGDPEPTPTGDPGKRLDASRVWWRRITVARIVGPVAFAAAGYLFVTSAISSDGTDLRAERQTDLAGLVRDRAQHAQELAAEVSQLRTEVDELGEQLAGSSAKKKEIDALADPSGMTAVQGPGIVVTLDDARPATPPEEVDPDALIVHQQDIQAVVNAMWAGGAEAMSIQGQRVISTSAIRCVGNSVVLHGVPYPPPYTIAAIGDVDSMIEALSDSPGVRVYLDYVERFGLGYALEERGQIDIPAFEGALELAHAQVPTD